MRARYLLASVLVVVGVGIGAAGAGAGAKGEIPGITLNVQGGVVLHNLNLYGFFSKTGVSCSDFTGAPVTNTAITFGPIVVLDHPENGKPGCLVQAQTIKFLKTGTVSFKFTLTETGAHTGTDTVDDTAIVIGPAGQTTAQVAAALIKEAVGDELEAGDDLHVFIYEHGGVASLHAAAGRIILSAHALSRAGGLPQLPHQQAVHEDISKAEASDKIALRQVDRAITKKATVATPRQLALLATGELNRGLGSKHAALKILGS